uniref:Electrin-4 n=1 Tax=Litoria rubella TaxID=104895 RepID=EI04_LITRU
FITVH